MQPLEETPWIGNTERTRVRCPSTTVYEMLVAVDHTREGHGPCSVAHMHSHECALTNACAGPNDSSLSWSSQANSTSSLLCARANCRTNNMSRRCTVANKSVHSERRARRLPRCHHSTRGLCLFSPTKVLMDHGCVLVHQRLHIDGPASCPHHTHVSSESKCHVTDYLAVLARRQ